MVVAQVLNCSMACGIFLNQGWNPCLLSWQVDSLPLSHQGSTGLPLEPQVHVSAVVVCAVVGMVGKLMEVMRKGTEGPGNQLLAPAPGCAVHFQIL